VNKIIYLTGASSDLGEAIRTQLNNSNYKVILYSRRELKVFINERYVKFNLGDRITPLNGDYEHIIIHLAHDYNDRRTHKSSNVLGLTKIIQSFKNVTNKKIIFISTADCVNKKSTIYTSQKRKLESMLNHDTDLIVRPSIIFSNNGINKLFKNLPRYGVPMPINNNNLAPMEVEKFSHELLNYGIKKNSVGVVLFCGKVLMTYKDFIYKEYKIKTFGIHNSFWLILILFLKLTRIKKLFYISERILGFIYLRDISDLHEKGIDKKYV